MDETRDHSVLTVGEDIIKAATDLRRTFDDKTKAYEDKQAIFEGQLAELQRKLDAAPRKAQIPAMEVGMLRFGNSPAEFQRMLTSRPEGSNVEVAMVEDLQRAADDFYFTKMILDFHTGGPAQADQVRSLKAFQRFDGMRQKVTRALDATTATDGLEWIPTGYSAQIRAKVAVALRAAGLIPTLPMPTNPWIFPFEALLPTVQNVSETLTASASSFDPSGATEMYPNASGPTGKATFTLKKHRALQIFSREFEEDSVGAAIGWLKDRIGYAIARGRERAMLNGATGTHIDFDLAGGAATIPEKTLNGIRKWWFTTLSAATGVSASAATPTSAVYRNVKALMGEFASDPSALAWLLSPLGMQHMMSMAQVQTLEKYGPGATILNGEIGRFDGSPVILSGVMKDNLHTTGVNVTGQSNNTTAILALNTLNWAWGEKGGLGLEALRMPFVDQTALVLFDRFDLEYLGASTDKCVGAVINIGATVTNVT